MRALGIVKSTGRDGAGPLRNCSLASSSVAAARPWAALTIAIRCYRQDRRWLPRGMIARPVLGETENVYASREGRLATPFIHPFDIRLLQLVETALPGFHPRLSAIYKVARVLISATQPPDRESAWKSENTFLPRRFCFPHRSPRKTKRHSTL